MPAACHKSTGHVTETLRLEQFPNKIGNYWVYQLYDSNYNYIDTVTSEISDSLKLQGIWGKVWTTPPVSGSLTALTIADTIFYYGGQVSALPLYHYVFPMRVGLTWIGSMLDTSQVVGFGAVETPARNFNNGFLLIRKWERPDHMGSIETWIVPNVGVVKINLHDYTLTGFSVRSWSLIDYHLE